MRNPAAPSTVALIETTLKTSGDQIRQFALDGNEDTCFVSEQNASPADHFTLVFETAVALREIRITTGRPNGSDQSLDGVLEASADGKAFEPWRSSSRDRCGPSMTVATSERSVSDPPLT